MIWFSCPPGLRAAEIVGTVRSVRTGQGISGALVRAIPQQRNRRDVQAQSNAEGRYHLELIRGKYKLFISVPNSNYLPQFYSSSDQERGDILDVPTFQSFMIANASLSSGGSIAGRVSRYTDNAPVASVRVSAESKDSRISVSTREDGTYLFQALPPADYRVHVVALDENYVSSYFDEAPYVDLADVIVVRPDQEVTGIDFHLRLGGSITGRVLAQRNREPISGIKIIAEKQNSKENPAFAYTDSQGFFALQGLPDGIYVVETGTAKPSNETSSTRSRYLTAYFENRFDKELATKLRVENGSSISGVNFTLFQSGRISGSVHARRSGSPLPEVAILPAHVQKDISNQFPTKTDESGTYLIENLAPGEYVLNASLPQRGRRFVEVYYQDKLNPETADRVFVEENGWTRGIDFSLILGATLRGRLKVDDPEYKLDASACSISLKRSPLDLEGFGERTYRLTSDGSFTIEGTPPGKYTMIPKLMDPNLRLQNNLEGKTFDLIEGEVKEEIEFFLKVGGSISGIVSTKNPNYTLDKLLLILINIKENSKSYFGLNSDHYALNGLEPGKYLLVLLSNPERTHPDSSFQPARVFDSRTIDVLKGKTTTGVDFQLAGSEN